MEMGLPWTGAGAARPFRRLVLFACCAGAGVPRNSIRDGTVIARPVLFDKATRNTSPFAPEPAARIRASAPAAPGTPSRADGAIGE
jgi:hypothetical protein